MDELTFRVSYTALGLVLPAVLLFLFSRRIDRKTYLSPVILGFFFAIGTSFLLGGGIIAFLFAGVLNGYLLNAKLRWFSLFRAGVLSGALLMVAFFVPGSIFSIGGGTFGLYTSHLSDILTALSAVGQNLNADQLLYYLIVNLYITTFIMVGIVGLGAILGGYLRKLLKPAAKESEEPKLQTV